MSNLCYPAIGMIALLAVGNAQAERVHVSTPSSSLLLDAPEGGSLRIMHYGSPLGEQDFNAPADAGNEIRLAYPAYGDIRPEEESSIACVQADGNMTLYLNVAGAPEKRTEADGSEIATITLRDPQYPVEVKVNYRTWPGEDVIETWTEISNTGKKPITLTRYDSGYLPIRRGDVWLTNFYGSWGNEMRVNNEELKPGIKLIKNADGVRNAQTNHAEVIFSLDGPLNERSGRVIGAALEYTGNYELRVTTQTDESAYHGFYAGICPDQSPYTLDGGQTLVTPPLALVYSDKGAGEVSRRFHSWGRNHRLAHGKELRPILLNSWEGVYLNVNEEAMAGMMKDIASMGGELFVMDDGWFGDRYPRVTDDRGLGDWTVDTAKLPNGINGLLDEAKKNGIKFGIWIEPEMVNTKSRLFEEHPEYVIQAKNRRQETGRGGTQMVLDMANPKVQDIVFTVVDTLLTKYPEIAYIKWDANAPIMQHGSQYLPADRQGHMNIEYHKGFAKVLDRIRQKYPDVIIQACASGGGRVNWGYLPWFDEFWTSDDTDALQRVFMQWGTSYFFPSVAMASHISVVPNHSSYRTTPLKFRADVAMTGRLGMELQPKDMNDEEKAFCRKAIETYKQIRPVVQQGDLYRLRSPYDNKGISSLMYVSPDKNEAVFYWFKLNGDMMTKFPRVLMDGLDPDRQYRITELNSIDRAPMGIEGKTFSGRYLMENGLEMPLHYNVEWRKRPDLSSRVLHLEAL